MSLSGKRSFCEHASRVWNRLIANNACPSTLGHSFPKAYRPPSVNRYQLRCMAGPAQRRPELAITCADWDRARYRHGAVTLTTAWVFGQFMRHE
jgi:hypothetical protein